MRRKRSSFQPVSAPVRALFLQRKCACGGSASECDECRSKRNDIQGDAVGHWENSSIVQEVLNSPGQPLSDDTRSEMERYFGHNFGNVKVGNKIPQISFANLRIDSGNDQYEAQAERLARGISKDQGVVDEGKQIQPIFDFRNVRVHLDTKAAEAARAVNAMAFTSGNHVVFGEDQFSSKGAAGRSLLAHELTHVIQQNQSSRLQRKPADGKRVPPRELPPHEPKAPTLTPAEGEIVQGFPVTKATCNCLPDIKVWQDKDRKAIEAYKACGPPRTRSIPEFNSCVRLKVYGPALGPKKALEVPAAASADPLTSAIDMPTEEEQKTRGEMIGEKFKEPQFGPCVPLLTWSTLVHESRHIEQFSEVAAKMGPGFKAEFEKLHGDPERMSKLRQKFPKEVEKYIAESLFSLRARVPMEIEATERGQQFLANVRSVLDRICKPPQPDVEPPKGSREG